MAILTLDNAFQSSLTQGSSSPYQLEVAAVPFRSFVAGAKILESGSGPWTVRYTVRDDQDFETGIATLTEGTGGAKDTLNPVTVYDSSNGGARVPWGPGLRNVVGTVQAKQLTSLTGDTAAGLIARTAQDAYATRTLQAADENQVAITDGDGADGDPTIALKGVGTLDSSASGKALVVQDIHTNGFTLKPFGLNLKNLFVNGSFDIWQRGTSFTVTGYTADRWFVDFKDGGGTVSRQAHTLGQTAVPGNPKHFLRFQQSSAPSVGNRGTILQRIEGVEKLAGLEVAVSGYFREPTSSKTFNVRARQHFGTGGSPSADVVTLVGSMTVNVTFGKATETVTLPGVSGKTLGTNGDDYLEIYIEGPDGATFTLDVSEMQVEEGAASTSFDKRPISFEMQQCLRYYWKSFDQSVAPAQNAGLNGALSAGSDSAAAGGVTLQVRFPIPMRAIPTVTTYNPSAANADFRDSNNIDRPAQVIQLGTGGCEIENTGSITNGLSHRIHADADAEL